jgi:hypothetical protein
MIIISASSASSAEAQPARLRLPIMVSASTWFLTHPKGSIK